MIPYIENFLTPQEADALFECVHSMPPVRPRNPRNGDSFIRKVSYGCYSVLPTSRTGMTVHGGGANYLDHAPVEIKSLAAKLSEYAGKEVNYLSLLGYENEKDHIGWHNHREDLTLKDQTVWVVSLAQVREVVIRPAGSKDKGKWEYLYPAHGSLYVLPSSYNTTHEHAVLDQDFPCSLRISINCKHIDAEHLENRLAKFNGKKPKTTKKRLVIATNGEQSIYCCRDKSDYPADAVYVGRKYGRWPDTPFGNHLRVPGDSAEWKAEVARLMKSPDFAAQVEALRGKDLLCWCLPKDADRCHARAWLEIANDTNPANWGN